MNDKILLELLRAKDKRAACQKQMIEKFHNTIISFSLNVPGEEKTSQEILNFFNSCVDLIIKSLDENKISINEKIIFNTDYDNYMCLSLSYKNAIEIKKIMTALEEKYSFTRLMDIDIFDGDYRQISRSDLGLEPRKCYICDREAKFCIKNKSHTYEELLDKFNFYLNEAKRR